MSLRARARLFLIALVVARVRFAAAAIDIANTSTVSSSVPVDARGLRLDVFTYPVAPTRVPDVRGAAPAHTANVTSIDVSSLPLASGQTVDANALARFRGRLRANVTGAHLFALEANAGGALRVNGGVVASSESGGNITGWKYLEANVEVEIEAITYNGASGTFSAKLYWRAPLSAALAVVPAEHFYASADSCCSCKCGTKPCRVSSDQAVVECFDVVDTSGVSSATAATSLESIFGVTTPYS